MKPMLAKSGWALLALACAACLGTIALRRGESINALWLVVALTAVVAALAPLTGSRASADAAVPAR